MMQNTDTQLHMNIERKGLKFNAMFYAKHMVYTYIGMEKVPIFASVINVLFTNKQFEVMAKKNASNPKAQSPKAQVTNVDNKVQSSNLICKVWNGTQYVERNVSSYDELVQCENSLINTYKIESSSIKSKVAIYRKSLESTLSDIEKLYNSSMMVFDGSVKLDIKANIDALVRLSSVSTNDLFNVIFVGGLYDTYTFKTLDGVQTLKSVKRKVSDKTDFSKLSERVQNVLGFFVDIEASIFEEKDMKYYWMPITNFSVSNVFNTVFSINKDSLFRIEREALKAAKRKSKAQAKKAEKKAAKANTEEK